MKRKKNTVHLQVLAVLFETGRIWNRVISYSTFSYIPKISLKKWQFIKKEPYTVKSIYLGGPFLLMGHLRHFVPRIYLHKEKPRILTILQVIDNMLTSI